MDEFSFIEAIKQNYYKQPTLIKGIGDDAAVFRSSENIVAAVDTFVEHIHFSRETMEPVHIGYRLLAANLSDLAAMGAVPVFYLVSIVIPKTWKSEEVMAIFQGMKQISRLHRMDLIGGDTVSGNELTITVTVLGYARKDHVRYRSAAKAGDVVFVTGTLGDSQAGYHILTNQGEYEDEAYYVRRHRMPEPRVAFSKEINLERVALNDVSDGIASEAHEIAAASKVSIVLLDETIPVSSAYDQFPEELQMKWKYFGGEDFELLGTAAEQNWEELQRAAAQTGTRLTKIGYVSSEDPGSVTLLKDDEKVKLPKAGYIHLK